MTRYRDVPDDGELFDHRAISSSPDHLAGTQVGLVWTCAENARLRPTHGKCQAQFSVEGDDPMVPPGWQWVRNGVTVSYKCAVHRRTIPEPVPEPSELVVKESTLEEYLLKTHPTGDLFVNEVARDAWDKAWDAAMEFNGEAE